VLKKLLAERGIDPRRLRLEFISGDDGKQFAKIMTSFVNELGTLVADPWRLTVRH
jgi:coenzyme F420-reducing hydrogenase delta subunit